MKFPRVRFTTRRLMMLVAVAGCLSGAEVTRRRCEAFRELALCHKLTIENIENEYAPATREEWEAQAFHGKLLPSYRNYPRGRHAPSDDDPPHIAEWRKSQARRIAFHEMMYRKYERATLYPWLLVEADPPQPE